MGFALRSGRGDRVSYEIGADRNGRTCAKHVRLQSQEAPQEKSLAGMFGTPDDAGSGAALANLLARDNREAE